MILLDTNVPSELMRPQPNPVVVAWANAQSSVAQVSVITQAEISLGIALLPEGKRRDALAAAAHFAHLVAERSRIVRPITMQDAQIAAIALANNMPLATHNLDDFEGISGLALVDPWNEV